MHFRTLMHVKTAPSKNAFSEHWCTSKLFPQKMHFRRWVLKDSNRWLLIKKLAYEYYKKNDVELNYYQFSLQ